MILLYQHGICPVPVQEDYPLQEGTQESVCITRPAVGRIYIYLTNELEWPALEIVYSPK